MKRLRSPSRFVAAFLLMLLVIGAGRLFGADTLNWNTNNNRVTADITSVPLLRLLEVVSQLTGWHVYVESNATRNVSVKFKDLPAGDALRSLLGNLNFALVPQTDSRSRLYVFQSSQRNATLLVRPSSLDGKSVSTNPIPNELQIKLKAGRKIENLDCLGDAKIVGRIDGLNTYRIRFSDEAATRRARECLENNPDVESVDSNFSMDRPQSAQSLDLAAADFNLKAKDPSGDCNPIIALIDTGVNVNSLAQNVQPFFMPSVSVMDNKSGAGDSQELTHGPAMAETILHALQSTSSGSSSARILSVDVYGNQPTTTTFDVTQGIYRAINSGANIINLSLGSPGDSSILHNLIKQASGQGIVFFGAAGNEPVTTPTYPAAYPEVIAVTAGDRNGDVASYANRGSFVDLMTPGSSVVPFNGQSYLVNGTSASTAYASGIAAGLAGNSGDCPPGVIAKMRSQLGVNFGRKP